MTVSRGRCRAVDGSWGRTVDSWGRTVNRRWGRAVDSWGRAVNRRWGRAVGRGMGRAVSMSGSRSGILISATSVTPKRKKTLKI